MYDYHLHTHHSHDAHYPIKDMVQGAVRAGITEICITDHLDIGEPEYFKPPVMSDLSREIRALMPEHNGVRIKLGMEVSLNTGESGAANWDYIKDWNLDFIIASVHSIGRGDVMRPEFYAGMTKEELYRSYLEAIINRLPAFDHFCALGHYNFCAKFAPYEDTRMKYADFRDEFDAIFRYLIERGKTLEINTSAWRNDPAWGVDVYARFVELGGEYITMGSDAHQPERVGRRMQDAVDLARAAGIRYVATFDSLKPTLHKL